MLFVKYVNKKIVIFQFNHLCWLGVLLSSHDIHTHTHICIYIFIQFKSGVFISHLMGQALCDSGKEKLFLSGRNLPPCLGEERQRKNNFRKDEREEKKRGIFSGVVN